MTLNNIDFADLTTPEKSILRAIRRSMWLPAQIRTENIPTTEGLRAVFNDARPAYKKVRELIEKLSSHNVVGNHSFDDVNKTIAIDLETAQNLGIKAHDASRTASAPSSSAQSATSSSPPANTPPNQPRRN